MRDPLPCRLGNVVLELLCSLDFELAVLVEGIIGWNLEVSCCRVVFLRVSETVRHGSRRSRFSGALESSGRPL